PHHHQDQPQMIPLIPLAGPPHASIPPPPPGTQLVPLPPLYEAFLSQNPTVAQALQHSQASLMATNQHISALFQASVELWKQLEDARKEAMDVKRGYEGLVGELERERRRREALEAEVGRLRALEEGVRRLAGGKE